MSDLHRAKAACTAGVLASGLLLCFSVSVLAEPAGKPAARTANAQAVAKPEGRVAKKGGQSIAILVNDEPITAYEIEQRAALLASQGGGANQADFKAKAEARWKSIIQNPKTNERFKEMLRKNNVQSQEEARALQTKFVKGLQADMMDQLRREMRSGAVAGSRKRAEDELIEEKLKMQEAKRLNVVTEDAELDRVLTGIAERNNMNLEQFGKHMKGMGIDINTMRSRFRAEMSWREVVRRRFGHLIAITDRDVDEFVANTTIAPDTVELQVQRITLPISTPVDQAVIAQKIAEADGLRANYGGCATMPGLAAASPGAKHEDLGMRKAATIPEPTRSLLMAATDGDLLPASVTQAGVELWALCSRKIESGESSMRENAQAELRQKEFGVLAAKHLKDLKQDAAIENR